MCRAVAGPPPDPHLDQLVLAGPVPVGDALALGDRLHRWTAAAAFEATGGGASGFVWSIGEQPPGCGPHAAPAPALFRATMYWKKPQPQTQQRLTASTHDDSAGRAGGEHEERPVFHHFEVTAHLLGGAGGS